MNLTKFYFNDMKGAPILASEWGSLLDVIRTIAITGFNELVVQAYQQEGLYLTLTFAEDHGYLKDQIIALSGSEQEEINSEFEVFATTLSTIKIKIPSDTPVTGSLTCKTAGMGWTEVFTGEHKAVFRAKNIVNNPFYLRVDNSCPIGYDPTWAKFARVTMAEGMITIDDFADFVKAPVYQNIPRDRNENGNGVSGATGIFGIAKWYHGIGYAGSNSYYATEATTNHQSSNLGYEIIGDNSSIYLNLRSTTRRDSRSLYAFTPFIKTDSKDSLNGFLSASHGHKRANQSDGPTFSSGNNSYGNKWYSLESEGKYGLSNWNGITNTSPNFGPTSLNLGNNQQISGRSSNIPFPNPGSNSVILSDIYLKESGDGGIRGTLPLLKWINNNWTYGNRFILTQENVKYIIIGNDYNDEGMTSFFAYRLER